MKNKSAILYRGPSVLTGDPIVMVGVYTDTNRKTGAMLQTYIMVDNGLTPTENAKSLADAAVCGACPHRQGLQGACYVNLGHGPRAVMGALMRGAYPEALNHRDRVTMGAGRMVRMGTYGDPAAVPYIVWLSILSEASGHTGYTHQARHPNFDDRLLELCMVSVDTEKQYHHTHKRNATARTFRVMGAADTLQAGEIECLADSKGLTCVECGLCDGAGTGPSIAIRVHGALVNRYETKLGRIPVAQ